MYFNEELHKDVEVPSHSTKEMNKLIEKNPGKSSNFIQLCKETLETTGDRRANSFFFSEGGKNFPRPPIFIKYFHSLTTERLVGSLKEEANRYKCPQGYANWKWVINWIIRLNSPTFMNTEGEIPSKGDRYCFQIEGGILAAGALIGRTDCPKCNHSCTCQGYSKPLVLTREIAEAFINTDVPPFKAAPNDILPSFCLMLPSNLVGKAWTETNGEETISDYKAILVITNNQWRKVLTTWIFDKMNKQQDQTMEFLENPTGSKRPPEITFKWEQEMLKEENYMEDDPNAYMFKSGFKIIALGNKCDGIIADYCWEDGTTKLHRIKDAKRLKKNQDEVKCLINIVANTIITLSHDPDKVTVKSPLMERGSGFGKKEGDEIPPQPITWIGEDYKPKVQYEYPAGYIPKKGTSPRTHWRKGHYRTVRQGPGRKQIHRVWIEPILVNPSKEQ
tara:strand:- start:42 stop:1382 length:1341 start_codon:yes stop_codon:yes gene_type:complete